jgi:hypothetical protein
MASPAGAVSAKKPLQGSFHEEFSFDIDCGTFLLHEDVVEDGAFTVFFDADGAPMNVIVHHHFHGVITNPAGETFDDRGDWTDFIDLAATPDDIEDDIVAQAGSIFRIRVPGEGIVVQDTGLIIFFPDGTVEIHGPHEQFVAGTPPSATPSARGALARDGWRGTIAILEMAGAAPPTINPAPTITKRMPVARVMRRWSGSCGSTSPPVTRRCRKGRGRRPNALLL